MNFLSLFSGVGGLDLGLERSGMKCVAQVEIDQFCRRVLAKHWPDVLRFEDVRDVNREALSGIHIDCIAGGFPCQDISHAGERAGLEGERSGLWAEFYRLIREIRPRFVLVENVAALLVPEEGKFPAPISRVLGDLADSGHDAEWDCLPAGHFGAPHLRERVFILAYPNKGDGATRMGSKQDRSRTIFAGRDFESFPIWLQAADRFVGVDDGVRGRVYRDRAGACGNAVVPQVAEWIGRRIIEVNAQLNAQLD